MLLVGMEDSWSFRGPSRRAPAPASHPPPAPPPASSSLEQRAWKQFSDACGSGAFSAEGFVFIPRALFFFLEGSAAGWVVVRGMVSNLDVVANMENASSPALMMSR